MGFQKTVLGSSPAPAVPQDEDITPEGRLGVLRHVFGRKPGGFSDRGSGTGGRKSTVRGV